MLSAVIGSARSPRSRGATLRRGLGVSLVAALLGGLGFAAPAVAAETAPTDGPVAEATLDWGVKESFRNYIYNFKMFEGRTELLGNATQPVEKGSYGWSGGTGMAALDGSSADVSFGAGNGVHFQSHPMEVDGGTAYALDMTFTNPHVVVTSPTTAELRLDVQGYEFDSMTSIGAPYTLTDAPVASLTLPESTVEGAVRTWTNAEAKLTDEGSIAFGGFYNAGDDLDPVTFSLPTEGLGDDGGEGEGPGTGEPGGETPAAVATTTTLTAEHASLREGETAVLTATVAPADAAGSVRFLDGERELGKPVKVAEGAAVLRTTALGAGGHQITAAFVPADPAAHTASVSSAVTVTVQPKGGEVVTGPVETASLEWGVKQSFRNYIYNFTAFEGFTTLLGNTQQPVKKGSYVWPKGSGTAQNDGYAADVAFGVGNGVHFQSHPMKVDGKNIYALDLSFTNPRVVIDSPSHGMLHMDVTGRKFEGMTSAGEMFTHLNTPIAELSLTDPKHNAATGELEWKNVGAKLTPQGEVAFGEFYSAGEQLDPLNFSLAGDFEVTTRTPTSVKLSASPASTVVGKRVTLTAKVAPAIPGTVKFSYGNTQIGDAVRVQDGKAEISTTKLPLGVHRAQATFYPTDEQAYAHSFSNLVDVTIDKQRGTTGGGKTPGKGSARGAGSLRWGISDYFAGYTREKSNTAACPTPSRHCAGGEIRTSGVGSGYLFPQAGSKWNEQTQTGSVSFSGSVSFHGYGITMFQVVNPTITVNGPNSATLSTGYSGNNGPSSVQLDLGAAKKSIGAGGEVTWENVPVKGGLMGISASQRIEFDSLSFTVGSESSASFGTTQAGNAKKKSAYTAAATPPSTQGLEVITDAKKLTPGARIEVRGSGFDPEDEGVLVVLYSDPTVLDDSAKANSAGVVTWSGKLPDDIKPGEHVLTLQGSTDVGAKITVLEKSKSKRSAATATATERDRVAAESQGALAIAGPLSPAGMALWEWWASALGLVLIAGCTSVLAARQRSRQSVPGVPEQM